MSSERKAERGWKFRPRQRKQGHDTRFNDRTITILDFCADPEFVLVTSQNARLGTIKRQRMSLARLLSKDYERVSIAAKLEGVTVGLPEHSEVA